MVSHPVTAQGMAGAPPAALRHPACGRRHPRGRAPLVVSAGEGRSANRTKWQAETAASAAAAVLEPPPPPVAPAGPSPFAGADRAAAQQPQPRQPQQPQQQQQQQRPSEREDPSALVWRCAAELAPVFADADRLIAANVARVQAAFRAARVGPHHFAGSTGYGHGDLGRAALDDVFAAVMGAEAAAVRAQFVSGTHAIAAALFGVLRPGDELLAVAGRPYDTMEEVIGIRARGGAGGGAPASGGGGAPASGGATAATAAAAAAAAPGWAPNAGSLADWGVGYRQLELAPCGGIDWAGLAAAVVPGRTRAALVQRSCGYALRPTLSVADIGRVVDIIKAKDPSVVVVVDNCYGEFTDVLEPPAVGADLAAGSLIKNPGGTLAPAGGYVAGRAPLVAAALARLSAPGVGADAGAVSGAALRLMFQGLFLAPQAVGEALKGGRLAAAVLAAEGYGVAPPPGAAAPWSAITAVRLGSPARMVAFARAVQAGSPVGSYVRPEPGATPGYADEVVFADGTFVDGSTSELSADGPLRPPHVVYCQGGTHWVHWAVVLEAAVAAMRAAEGEEGGR